MVSRLVLLITNVGALLSITLEGQLGSLSRVARAGIRVARSRSPVAELKAVPQRRSRRPVPAANRSLESDRS
jgi:hypothetical protein